MRYVRDAKNRDKLSVDFEMSFCLVPSPSAFSKFVLGVLKLLGILKTI